MMIRKENGEGKANVGGIELKPTTDKKVIYKANEQTNFVSYGKQEETPHNSCLLFEGMVIS